MTKIVLIMLFVCIPLSSIWALFLKDVRSNKKTLLNVLLIINAVLFLWPLGMAYFLTPAGGNMWDENGAGGYLWFYMILLPLCFICQCVLLSIKLKNSKP
ncbi:MAG: hypothetical protein IPO92_22120 [Saprospiraceae bacterium]|nr:hypothetical protein [Saprospiraceae bacterium]